MEDIIKKMIELADKQHSTQKSIVDYIKRSIQTPHRDEYFFLQNNPNGTQKELTVKQLAIFYHNVADTMIPYYWHKQVNAGVNEFFSMYQQLGANQQKEKSVLAYNFFLTDRNDKNYPFHYSRSDGLSCGRNFEYLQTMYRSMKVLTKDNINKYANMELGLDGFVHLYPFGQPEEVHRRIYINTTPENATFIATELFKKCAMHPDDEMYRPYCKFHTKDNRNDTMLVYCTEKNFDIMFELITQIYQKHREWFNGTCKLPLLPHVNDAYGNLLMGIADEPSVKEKSYNSLFCYEIINAFKTDLEKKLGVKDLSTLPVSVLDKYVTYDNVKPYIEKTCYSGDYPFLTKETVRNKKPEFEKKL
ncbi:MAG: hypothetical protein J5580_00895 [Clostridia bacterium]|nr:hypothetical protein [Clostridia bacterium]